MSKNRDKKRARNIAQAQKDRQQVKATAPPAPVSSPVDLGRVVPAILADSDAPFLLTPADLCQRLGVSRSTLDRLVKAGKIPGRVMLGAQVRYHRIVIEAWLLSLVEGKDA